MPSVSEAMSAMCGSLPFDHFAALVSMGSMRAFAAATTNDRLWRHFAEIADLYCLRRLMGVDRKLDGPTFAGVWLTEGLDFNPNHCRILQPAANRLTEGGPISD
jgi:hypothetical protein